MSVFSGRDSAAAPAFEAGADFAQRPGVDAAPADEVGGCEGAAPEEVCAPAAGDVVAPEAAVGAGEAPDVEDVVGADELPGLAGRGGAFAAGGGEAAGAGRAGGTVGIADLGAVLGGVAVRADIAEVAPGEVAAADVVADAPDADPLEVGVPDAAGDPEGRLASVEVVEAGLVASDARAVGRVVVLELVARVGVASVEAAPDAVPDMEVEADGADAAARGAEAAAAPRAAPGEEAIGIAPVFADGAGAREAPPVWAVCEEVGFDAGADLFEAGGVASASVAGLRAAAAAADDAAAGAEAVVEVVGAAAGEAEVGVAGAADRVGGTGASPDPRSVASSIGDAQVPEYALSVDVDAGMVGIPNPAGDICASAAVDALADALWSRAGAGAPDPVPWAAAAPGAGEAACDDARVAAAGACLAAAVLEEIGVGAVVPV